MRILLIGNSERCLPLADVLRTEGAHVIERDPSTVSIEVWREVSGVDAVVIDDAASTATLLKVLRDHASPVLRVLMVVDGCIRERNEAALHELLFPRSWTLAEVRVLCAWVRMNTRQRGSQGRQE